ncbi:hypothetical protein M0R04_05865 [Candidatus Dojkabacteria bacterium]|jgi:hypothetical protein|nr:hypothetical protein [Candidatus Dojkabacteria bacterium]
MKKHLSITLPQKTEAEDLVALQEFFVAQIIQLMADFKAFENSAQVALDEAEKVFLEKEDSDPAFLKVELSKCSSHSYRVGALRAEAKMFDTIFEAVFFCPKKVKFSEEDRKKYTRVKTLQTKYILSMLEMAEEKLDKKISSIQSVLKAETARYMKERQI